ncbi:MAG: histidine kinase [Saprospiraceae bacterium]|nr:histidine kinase [Saprospiraceae bacterium]
MDKYKKSILQFIFLFSSMALWTSSMMAQINIDSTYSKVELDQYLDEAQSNGSWDSLAAIYFLLAEYEASNFYRIGNSLENYSNAKNYYSRLQDSFMVHTVNKAIGLKYVKSGYFQEALESYEKALEYFISRGDLKSITHINYEISQVYKARTDPEKELQYLNRAIELNKELKDSVLMVKFMLHKIKSYETLNELDSAVYLALDAVRLSNEIQDDESMSKSLYQLGSLNKIRTEYDKAIKYLRSAEEYSSTNPFNEHRNQIYTELADCYERVDDFEQAYNYARKYASLNDSILNNNRIEAQLNLSNKYRAEEKQKNISRLKVEQEFAEERNRQQRNAMYILTAGLIMLLALLYYIINFYRQRMKAEEIINGQEQEISQQKIRELEDNIKISSMQSMLEGQENERERISKDLHDSLGGLLSTIKLQFDSVKSKMEKVGTLKEYKSANRMLDTAVAEVRSISQNLQPGSLMKLGLIPALKDLFNRFDEEIYPEIDFQHYNVPEKIPNMVSLSIYRVIQELLHNAIKHAKASEILIQINSEEDELVIQFEDDGVGYDISTIKSKGMGLENVKSRINYLKGQISTHSAVGEGTSTLIHVRYK